MSRAQRALRRGWQAGTAAIHQVRGVQPVVLASLALLVLGSWAFIVLAGEMLEGDADALDKRLLMALRRQDDPAVARGGALAEGAARDLTALGSFTLAALTTLTAAGFLVLCQRRRVAVVLALSAGGGALACMLLKELLGRPRPDAALHLTVVHSPSFPSGHAMMSAVVYLTIAAIVADVLPTLRLRMYAFAVAVGATALVGASRVYLGVHYPTDVLAGWLAGLVWAAACWLAARSWLRRERPLAETAA